MSLLVLGFLRCWVFFFAIQRCIFEYCHIRMLWHSYTDQEMALSAVDSGDYLQYCRIANEEGGY